MKTRLFVTTSVEIEHDEFTSVSQTAVTDAANVGAQSFANVLVNAHGAIIGTKRRAPSRVIATPSMVVTCADGHRHDLRQAPWSDGNVTTEEAIGQVE